MLAAGWEAQASWSALQTGRALIAAAGDDTFASVPEGFARAKALDRSRDDLAALLRISPGSVYNRLATARALHARDEVDDAGRDEADADADCADEDPGAATSDDVVDGSADADAAADAPPDLAGLVDQGLLFGPGLRSVTAAASHLPADIRQRVHVGMASRIAARREAGKASWSAGDLARIARRLALRLAPKDDADERAEPYRQRRVSVTDDTGGMAWLSAYVRDVDAHRISNRLTAAAAAAHTGRGRDRGPGDGAEGCTRDQHRADLLVHLLLDRGAGPDGAAHDSASQAAPGSGQGSAGGSPAPAEQGSAGTNGPGGRGGMGPAAGPSGCALGPVPVSARPDISVVVDAATLLGLSSDPAHLPGLGPIPADLARALAAEGRWRLLLVDPLQGGLVTAVSARTYAPSAAVARLVRSREGFCRWPGCTRPSQGCDLDHTIPYNPSDAADGDGQGDGAGLTEPANLGPLCRRHHNLKTHHGYTLTNLPPPDENPPEDLPDEGPAEDPSPGAEAWQWTTPSGLTHTRHPQPPLDN